LAEAQVQLSNLQGTGLAAQKGFPIQAR